MVTKNIGENVCYHVSDVQLTGNLTIKEIFLQKVG